MIRGGIIDAHLHLWDLDTHHYPWLEDPESANLRANYLVDDYRRDAADVPIAATVHVQAELDHTVHPATETSWLAAQAEASSQTGVPTPTVCVGYADLRAPNLNDVLDRHQEYALFRGIRQQAWFDPTSTNADVPRQNLLDDPTWSAGLRTLARRGHSFDLQVWPHQLEQAATIFRDLPELRLVLEHTGLPASADPDHRARWRAGMRRFARDVPNAVLKISALRFVSASWDLSELSVVVHEAIDTFGSERCLLGSNFPVDKPAVSYTNLWRTFDKLTHEYSADERASMFRETAARIYRIYL